MKKLSHSNRNLAEFIKLRREALSLSQKDLALTFSPPVSTQFISNLERGVTPVPHSQIETLSQSLKCEAHEIVTLLQMDLGQKFSSDSLKITRLDIGAEHAPLFQAIYKGFLAASPNTQQSFVRQCESMLNVQLKQDD